MLRPEVAPVSQTERLLAAMATKSVTHGQTVRADVNLVRVSAPEPARSVVYFCHVRDFEIRATVRPGDGQGLPSTVAISGLEVPREGFYDICNALVSSNGRVEITVDGRSRVVPARQPLLTLTQNM